MSQDTLNIIIGALIGFVPSALITLIIHLLSLGEKKKERERQIVKNRYDQIEDYASQYIRMVSKLFISTDRLSAKDETFRDVLNPYYDFGIFFSISSSTGDRELRETVGTFIDKIRAYNEVFLNSPRKNNLKLDEKDSQTLTDCIEDVRKIFEKIIFRLDVLRKKA